MWSRLSRSITLAASGKVSMSTGWALSFGIEGGVACVDLGHGAEREPPAWLAHEIARHSRLPRPDDSAARAREGGAFLATSRRSSGAASARPVSLPRRTDLPPGGPGINPVCPVSSESIFATPRTCGKARVMAW